MQASTFHPKPSRSPVASVSSKSVQLGVGESLLKYTFTDFNMAAKTSCSRGDRPPNDYRPASAEVKFSKYPHETFTGHAGIGVRKLDE